MIARNRQGGAVLEAICQAVLNVLYIILSATIVFAQLVVLIPACLKWFPYYKKSIYALDKIFQLDKEDEFAYPNESKDN